MVIEAIILSWRKEYEVNTAFADMVVCRFPRRMWMKSVSRCSSLNGRLYFHVFLCVHWVALTRWTLSHSLCPVSIVSPFNMLITEVASFARHFIGLWVTARFCSNKVALYKAGINVIHDMRACRAASNWSPQLPSYPQEQGFDTRW